MNRRLAGLALCLSIAAMPQFAMADNGKGKGAEMRDVIPGEQMRMDAEDRKADKTYFQWGMKPNSKTEEPHTIGEKMRAGI